MDASNKNGVGDKQQNEPNGKKTVERSSGKASFEDAIVATGFGKFNIFLLCCLIPSSFAQAFEQMGLSYVIPVAECDLNITLEQKGMLTAISFGGMITSGLFFGMISDMFGRKKLILYGYILNGLCSIVAASSQNFMTLMIAKFFCGFIFNGPFSACTTYLSEFHASEYRARVQLVRGITFSLGFLLLPLIAWVFLPLNVHFSIFETINVHSWNLYLLFCASGPLVAALGFSFLPESPKFLMSNGRNAEALLVFQQVYQWNTGKSKSDYPIKELEEEVQSTKSMRNKKFSVKESIVKFFFNIKPLFGRPHLFRLILACSTSFTLLISLHSLKLWLPQILQLAADYDQSNETDFNVCSMMNTLSQSKVGTNETCRTTTINTSVYVNAIIITGPQILIFAASGLVVNCLGKLRLVAILSSVASLCAVGLYFAPNIAVMIVLFAIYVPFLDLSGVTLITVTLEMFPTHFRTLALSCHFMFARIGSMSANLLFSTLVSAGCFAPFLMCCVLTAIAPFAMLLYPNTENKALK